MREAVLLKVSLNRIEVRTRRSAWILLAELYSLRRHDGVKYLWID